MRKTEGIHGIFQGVVIVEKLQAACDGEYNFCARPHVQGMDSSRILDYVVPWFGNPVVSERELLLALKKDPVYVGRCCLTPYSTIPL
jgi:hypothetical protein